MREINVSAITAAVAELCISANRTLPDDVEACLHRCRAEEPWPPAQEMLDGILKNIDIAKQENLPLCQDTGMACVFLEIGQQVQVIGGNLNESVQDGVRQGYREGYLRKSVVGDPLHRINTGDNYPALVHMEIVAGDELKITVAPKGFGSENMSRLKMLKPSDGEQGVYDFILETVELAGPNPCPPIVVGVGIGGSFERVALLAKKALLRPLNQPHHEPSYRDMEEKLLRLINETGIGPQGFGGMTTALGVNIEVLPTHIAALPVAVNINCHVSRHATAIL